MLGLIDEYLNHNSSMDLLVARGRFELPSAGPEPAMLGHYTTGLQYKNLPTPLINLTPNQHPPSTKP
jgi:hypothetical protein